MILAQGSNRKPVLFSEASFQVTTSGLSWGFVYSKLVKPYLNTVCAVKKIHGVRRDRCQRYYQGIRVILCLGESDYKAIGFLKKETSRYFLRVLANSCFIWQIYFPEALRVRAIFDIFFILNKALQQCAVAETVQSKEASFTLAQNRKRLSNVSTLPSKKACLINILTKATCDSLVDISCAIVH